MTTVFPSKLPDRPQKPSLTKRLTQRWAPRRAKQTQSVELLPYATSAVACSPAEVSSTSFATDPHVASSHVLTRQATSSPVSAAPVKAHRESSRASLRNRIGHYQSIFTLSPQQTNAIPFHEPSCNAIDPLSPAPPRTDTERKEFPKSSSRFMKKDPLVARFEKLRLSRATMLAPAISRTRPPNFSHILQRPSYNPIASSGSRDYGMAMADVISPETQEQPQPSAFQEPRRSSGPIVIDADTNEEMSISSRSSNSNFSNTNFFQSGGCKQAQRRQTRVDDFLRRKSVPQSRSPSTSSSDSAGAFTPNSSKESFFGYAARIAQMDDSGLSSLTASTYSVVPPENQPTSVQEEQDFQLAQRLQQKEDDAYQTSQTLLFERRRSTAWRSASPGLMSCNKRPFSSMLQANPSSGTKENPISLDSDSEPDTKTPRLSKSNKDLNQRPSPPRTRDCAVCGDSFPIMSLPFLANCIHPPETCSGCYTEWITAQLQGSGWSEVKCPEHKCKVTLTYHEIQEYSSTQTFQQYDTFIARQAMSEDPDFRWCRACDSGQIHLSGVDGNIFTCAACHNKSCTIHESTWHEGETCEEYEYRSSGRKERDQRAQEAASLQAIDKLSKKCPGPNCVYNIEKNDGCDHMTCSKCRYEFCWICLCDYNAVRRQGNSVHAVSCKYHTARLV